MSTIQISGNVYFVFLNMKLKTRQAMAKKSPAVARIIYTTESGIATVTIFNVGMPSVGIPSVKEGEEKLDKHEDMKRTDNYIELNILS